MAPSRAPRSRKSSSAALGGVALALLLVLAAGAQAQSQAAPDAPARKAFRACQDPSNLPFSNTKGEGFENRIAELFAAKLGLPAQYYSFPQRMAFIRNTLRYKLPGEDFRCDVVMSVPAGYDQVASTRPYYRSTYALVYARGGKLDGVKAGNDLFAVSPELKKQLRIGIYDKSPATDWLAKRGWEDQAELYQMLSPNPEQYPGEIIEKDLAQGRIDAAVVWGPIAGFFARRVRDRELVVLPLRSEPGVRFDFEIAMGVRHGEPEWRATIEKLIAENQPAITAILREYNVPLLDERGELIPR